MGWPKVLRYVGIGGTIAAACNAFVVPLSDRLARGLAARTPGRAGWRTWGLRTVGLATTALWVFALVQQL